QKQLLHIGPAMLIQCNSNYLWPVPENHTQETARPRQAHTVILQSDFPSSLFLLLSLLICSCFPVARLPKRTHMLPAALQSLLLIIWNLLPIQDHLLKSCFSRVNFSAQVKTPRSPAADPLPKQGPPASCNGAA